ncbi:MAG: DNA gyrase inhibitor YacG [Brachymonas sp.]|nr:DNA gyrase inhibitor YacG [Brachymonas sp.]
MVDSASTDSPRLVPCPQCGQDSVYAPSNPYRPFCSKRCKLIDLGAWSSESYRMAEPGSGELGDGEPDTDEQHG